MASLSLKHINKTYPNGFEAVKDFNLEIEDKEFIIFVGPSGCGKSTTLRMIAGLEEITSGELKIGDKVVNDVEPKDRDIAMVFQNYALYPHMTVYDNMAFGLKLRKVPKPEIDKMVREAAKILDLEPLLDRKPKALSGGQRQRVAMGRAIVRNPKVFLMDEPLSNLDAKLRGQMRIEISKLHQRLGTTIIYVTHDQTEAMTLGTRIVVMNAGVVQQVDTPQVLYDTPCNLFVAGFIGSPQMNFLDAVCQKKGDKVVLKVGPADIVLPPAKAKKLIDGGYEGKTVVLGIRPEDVHDEQMFIEASPNTVIEATIRVYEMLGVKFDAYTGESFYNDKMDAVVQELKDKNLLKESEGAMIVDLEDKNMPPCLIIRKDGGTLYATRDITAALYRKKTYNFDKCIYLTALDQNLHFAQWFEVIHKMGYDWYKDLIHVPFGLVSLDSGKLSTRHGHVVLMEDLLNQACAETKRIIEEKNPNLENKEEIAKQVGIGAVIFNDLYNTRIKDVVFSWERMLNFDGETGPYVQYTHARACSILKRAGEPDFSDIHFEALSDEASLDVCKLLEAFPDKIKDAAAKLEPSVVTRHLVAIAQAFNKFYHDNPILSSEPEVRQARLAIVFSVKTVLKKGLALLGIEAPEQM